MTEPTQEQKKEFWEWCGFTMLLNKEWEQGYQKGGRLGRYVKWEYPDGSRHLSSPRIDLNSLLRYAVPQFAVKFGITKTSELLHHWVNDAYMSLPSAAELFWAIWKVIKE